MDSKKKQREPVFSHSEKEHLLDLVQSHFDVLECKRTDAQSVHTKTERWKILAEEFNASFNQYRDWTKLKTLWENLKKRAKAALADDNLYVSGGDKGKNSARDPILVRVMELLVGPKVEPVLDSFDNDYIEEDDDENGTSCSQVINNHVTPAAHGASSSRGPVLRPPHIEAEALNSATNHIDQRYALEMEILQLRRDQEKCKLEIEWENLKQAKIRTAILKRKLGDQLEDSDE